MNSEASQAAATTTQGGSLPSACSTSEEDGPETLPASASESRPLDSSTVEPSTPKSNNPLSASHLKEKLHHVREKVRPDANGSSLQDRLFGKLLQQILPPEDLGHYADLPDERSSEMIEKPGFSLPLMTSNFRRFNSRIGVVFIFQHRLIRLLSWKAPTHTLSLLSVYTFVCLDPYLLAVLPVAGILLFLMVSAFLTRHPPLPSTPVPDPYSASGPALAPPPDVKPVGEFSKDFFRNLRDLQNSMDDFSRSYDALVALISPLTNFSDERLSSAVFLLLALLSAALFLAARLLPWRFLFLLSGWALILLGHPQIRSLAARTHTSHVKPLARSLQTHAKTWISADISLSTSPLVREVEIFELQRLNSAFEWESFVFSPSPYDPLCAPRIAGVRAAGTRFFEDVSSPAGWGWGEAKWRLDLNSAAWVEERMVTGVEVETDGERWVIDLPAAGEGSRASEGGLESVREEGSALGEVGAWRRRRWVRLVQRDVVGYVKKHRPA
ncbi:MAG: hypothetical protein M1829_000434 [Trizodia sp. TS-e1964]|nr:MAG: hypothetical protein M1829_000434 [Trizodia sp. TS-e1964]